MGAGELDRTLARAEVEGEVRAEYDAAARGILDSERDKRMVALVLTITLSATVLLPVIAAVAGISWRVLMWTAGVTR